MDSEQLKALTTNDPYLKKYSCLIIAENELPGTLQPNTGYFVLLPGMRKGIGHWILIESFAPSPSGFSYWDPLGSTPSTFIHEKLLTAGLLYESRIFINSYVWQSPGTVICGPICVYIALLRSRNFSPGIILKEKNSGNARTDSIIIVDIVNSLLPKKFSKVPRFSLDFV